jgi:hypothetical protein
MQEYVVCIPSYKRPRLCNDLTLAMLMRHGIDPARIHVYVADDAEREIYLRSLDRSRYGALVVAVPGIVDVREFIVEQWPEGTNIVSVDDDVREVTFDRSAYDDMHTFFGAAFEECRKRGAYIWGVHPLANPFFLRGQEVTTDLRYVVGAFYGFINRPRLEAIRWDISRQCQGAKDDVELTILYFANDGLVLRFNRIGISTTYFRAQGGQGKVEKRKASHIEACRRLLERYPKYGYLRLKSNGITDFALRRRPGDA